MRILKSAVSALLLSVSLLSPAAFAGGIEELHRFVRDTQSARGTFEQVVSAQSGRKPQRSSGEFAFLRPGLFRWEYHQPYPQLLIGDGSHLWAYDPELKQATVKPLDDALGATPAALLASDGAFEQAFVLTEQGEAEGYAWVAAEPRRADSSFVSVRLGFAEGMLRVMELLDHFGQRTRLEFIRFERNVALDRKGFQFVPPQGVDVIGEAGGSR